MENSLKLNSGIGLRKDSAFELLNNLNRDEVKKWFAEREQNTHPFFYSSVDMRRSGNKLAPVDTNIFPAGWNNLSKTALEKAAQTSKEYFAKYHPQAKSIAIFAENFSRNKFYWENISTLKSIIENTGLHTNIYVDDAEVANTLNIHQTNYDFVEDVIIINRDFTSGSPEALKNCPKPVIPPPLMGWFRRKKNIHFESYNKIASEFARDFNFDSWLISSYHSNCGKVNFKEKQGLECVAVNIEKTLARIRLKYTEYGITSQPYVFVKSNTGTFGMGIMTATCSNDVLEMNKKLRNKMDTIKEGVQNTEVIIQEGIPTIDKVDGKTAEPFVYLIAGMPIGAILRVNQMRDEFGNLNSSGMEFHTTECSEIAGACELSPYGIIARLASLASLDEKYL